MYGLANGCRRAGVGDGVGTCPDVIALISSGPMFLCCLSTRAGRTTRIAVNAAVDKSVIALTNLSTSCGRRRCPARHPAVGWCRLVGASEGVIERLEVPLPDKL